MELDGKPLPTHPQAFLLEMVVIVGSILLAFALDAGWDTWRERSEERATLVSLREEFTHADTSLVFYMDFDRRILSATEALLVSARQGVADGRAFVTVDDTLLAWTSTPPTFDPRMPTLDGIIASDRVTSFRDPELSHALSGWPGVLSDAAEEQEAGRLLVFNHLDPILRREMDIARGMEVAGAVINRDGSAPLDGVSRMPANFEVLGVFARRRFLLAHGLDEFEAVRDEVRRILGLIDGALRH